GMKRDLRNIDKLVERGNFTPSREWLRKHIHSRGKLYTASGLVRKVTGEELNSDYFIGYLKQKYGRIYKLNS
ncbi:MAG: carboxypeptidase M32, partial [Candidatus Doudnabacteria bacterium]|nr:carboxypeptidase M32 [Candidatus Doudnabacteria bacterium]